MIESKVLACVARSFLQVRDVLDVFLFQDALRPDSPGRLSQKFGQLSLPPARQWSLTDCISFIVMQDAGLSDALTADHHFEQAGFRALPAE